MPQVIALPYQKDDRVKNYSYLLAESLKDHLKTVIVDLDYQAEQFSLIKEIKGFDVTYFNRDIGEIKLLPYDLMLVDVSFISPHLSDLFKIVNFILISLESKENHLRPFSEIIDEIKESKKSNKSLIVLNMLKLDREQKIEMSKNKENIKFL